MKPLFIRQFSTWSHHKFLTHKDYSNDPLEPHIWSVSSTVQYRWQNRNPLNPQFESLKSSWTIVFPQLRLVRWTISELFQLHFTNNTKLLLKLPELTLWPSVEKKRFFFKERVSSQFAGEIVKTNWSCLCLVVTVVVANSFSFNGLLKKIFRNI